MMQRVDNGVVNRAPVVHLVVITSGERNDVFSIRWPSLFLDDAGGIFRRKEGAMADTPSVSHAWMCRATIQILKSAEAPHVIGNGARGFEFRPARYSPEGRQRLDLFVDMTMGERKCLNVVQTLLRAMSRAAEAGRVRGFRIVNDSTDAVDESISSGQRLIAWGCAGAMSDALRPTDR
jgi:hypothetical protein